MKAAHELRFKCDDCDWIGVQSEIDRVPDPKPGSDVVWNICPKCRAAEQLTNICDQPECDKQATIGEPTEHGYQRVCYEHSNMFKEKEP